jgi:hypothetical protein
MIRTFIVIGIFATSATAQETPALSLTLDDLTQVDAACRLTFVARNELAAAADPLVVEAVAFDTGGGVARIALFDFGALPAGRTRVRQFDLSETACVDVGSMLINGVQRCVGPEGCAEALTVASRAEGVEMTQ